MSKRLMPEITCRGCGATVADSPSANRSYCSRQCYYSHKPKGELDPHWKGGVQKHPLGYLIEYEGRKLQHRKVMEDHLGRELLSKEIVHHKDGDKKNNSIENLELTNRADHLRIHRSWEWRTR